MTNLEGRVILRAAGRRAAGGRAHRPRGDRRAGRAARRAGAVRHRPRGGLRRARPGLRRRPRRLRRHHLRPDPRRARRLLAVPGRRAPRARRGCSPTGSPTPTAGPGSSPSTTAGRPSRPTTTTRVHLTTGRVLAQYQSGAQTRRVRDLPDDGPVRRAAPDAGRPDRRARRRAGRRHHPPRRAQGAGPGGHHDPAGHGLRAVPLGRRQPADQRRARPGQPDAGVQGLRLRRCAHERPGRGRRRRDGGRAGWSRSSSRAAGRPVTVLGDEPHPPYNRILLSAVLEGTHDAATRCALPACADHGVDLRLGARVRRGRPGASAR